MKKRLFCDATYHQYFNANPLNSSCKRHDKINRQADTTSDKIGFKYRMER
ncbi:MAG: hypothetical protein IJ104_00675 [Methanobrevibacter sp.]|nr:hypothetical protein [Methanobrevibacter sp.]MBQ9024883.1 hypothetical protein [Methanobrevibacter sp.]